MNTIILHVARLSVVLMCFSVAIPASAKVRTVSLERTFVGENIRVLEVEVSCIAVRKGRRLRKIVSENGPWCAVDLPDMCATKKYTLARQVCELKSKDFNALVESRKSKVNTASASSNTSQKMASDTRSGESENVVSLLQEKMLIEEQRIQLEQKRLELRKKELELEKQLSE